LACDRHHAKCVPPSRCLLQFSLRCLSVLPHPLGGCAVLIEECKANQHTLFRPGCPSILSKTITLRWYETLSFYPDLALIIGSPVPRTAPAMAVVLSSFLRLTSSLSPLPTQTARTLSPPRQRRAAPQLCLHHQTCLPPLLHMFMHQRLPRQTLRHRHLKRQDVDDRDTPGNNNANIPMHWHRLHSPSHTRTITITRHSSSSSSSKRQLSGTSTRSRSLSPLYINLRQFSFQLPLWQDMRREGLPIEGFCVVAGIPTTEKADEIIDGLKSVGIHHVAFNQVP
jgi:hypothetical protein